MNFYSITYDLIRVRDYTKISRGIIQLCNDRWAKPTQSQWVVATNKTPGQIRDYLRDYLDHDDVLFIAKVDMNELAGLNLSEEVIDWLTSI